MKQRKRPYHWWKSGKVLMIVWGTGTLLVTAASLGFLYPQYQELQRLRAENAAAQRFIAQHKDLLKPSYALPLEPSSEELQELQGQLPVRIEPARLMTDLRGAVAESRATWVKLQLAEDAEDLPEMKEEFADSSPKLEMNVKHVKPLWGDLYVRASYDELKDLFAKLERMKRIITVTGWVFEDREKNEGNVRIRLMWYVYQDVNLKHMPPLPGLELPADETSQPVEVEWGTKKKKIEDREVTEKQGGSGKQQK
ncbi:hypothetical protein GCM10011571_23050 [Marinithermofilum abyssi]|uniref:Uncharacterized protein n=1 Tax=Marinithermofilum abyssi TaxID=1571185 RepID=A0A8J2VDZ3_9BACL|nr:hypothetical protein [Marinithermofilum abyssi]GGE20465.1 hypothetical protein GCM10011571_23050 [Marinithermofilum abyssi]